MSGNNRDLTASFSNEIDVHNVKITNSADITINLDETIDYSKINFEDDQQSKSQLRPFIPSTTNNPLTSSSSPSPQQQQQQQQQQLGFSRIERRKTVNFPSKNKKNKHEIVRTNSLTSPRAALMRIKQKSDATSSEFEKFDFNTEEIAVFRDTFSMFDHDGNGFITREEFQTVLTSFGLYMTDYAVSKMVATIDKDGDGCVNFDEFVLMMAKNRLFLTKDEEVHEIKEIFKIFDSNEDGFIEYDDISVIFRKLGEYLSSDDIKNMIKETDSDGDGKITFEDFQSMLH
ncbi:hypothetical protein SNEBB_011316 [Seison nebaliae]|nr:hypothetical protein SNEBB_011316 [Seison nebaliae]